MNLSQGYGTRFVWKSVISILGVPGNRFEAVIDETTRPISRFKFE